jgi:tellurite resistance protein
MSLPAVPIAPASESPATEPSAVSASASGTAVRQPAPFFRQLPVSAFAVVMGLSGLSLVWAKVAQLGWLAGLASPLAFGLGLFSGMVFLVLLLFYLRKWIWQPALVKQEWAHPVGSAFFAGIPVCFALLAAVALGIFGPIALPLWVASAVLQVLVILFILNAWIHRDALKPAHINPVWFIPAVATNMLVPLAGVRLGFLEVSWWFFAVGILFWGILLTMVLARMFFIQPPLPDRLVPAICIFLAPPALGFLSWILLTGQYPDGPGLDALSHLFFGLSIFFALFLATQIHWFARLDFYISWWAFSFPVAAFTMACLVYQSFVSLWLLKVLAVGMVGLVTILISWLFLRTLLAIWRREPQFVE